RLALFRRPERRDGPRLGTGVPPAGPLRDRHHGQPGAPPSPPAGGRAGAPPRRAGGGGARPPGGGRPPPPPRPPLAPLPHHPLLALYQSRAGEWEGAGRSLERGTAAVAAAIEIEPFLIPLAFRCAEFELHHARIARDRRQWAEMHRHVDRGVAMIGGRLP